MTDLDLRSFATRYRALVDSSPPTSRRETRAWLVDPLLETLGWDVHADSCLAGRVVDGTRFEYVCTIDAIPALFVAVEPFAESLERDRASAICQTMAWTGIDRTIYTNGRRLVLLAGSSDVDQFSCRLAAIDDYESSLTHFTIDRLGRRLERHSRDHVARRLALDRSSLVDSIVDDLVAVSGSTYENEFESATDRFIERLVASFASETTALPAADGSDIDAGVSIQFTDPVAGRDDPPQSGDVPADESTGTTQADAAAADDRAGSDDADDRAGTRAGEAGGDTDGSTDDDSDGDDNGGTDGDDEYVVRFFNDRGSIGAIGHSTPERALVYAAEYCFDRGLSGVDLPWGPDEGETVLNDRPVHSDGTPMTAAAQLSNGLYLNTGGSVDDRAARVSALASRSGLRAMLTGDWEYDED
ncbi:hypothetical protein ACFO5R_17440 [Halosolutus amylolyticus]|uniref:Restriction endonuclease n=1 Tax=Halosolutus amylolyticus TaxID=2932267 RepID=A0ABD5PTF2_9EURY|nr:hypothetical protein [Halosolutus amylolyticus]